MSRSEDLGAFSSPGRIPDDVSLRNGFAGVPVIGCEHKFRRLDGSVPHEAIPFSILTTAVVESFEIQNERLDHGVTQNGKESAGSIRTYQREVAAAIHSTHGMNFSLSKSSRR